MDVRAWRQYKHSDHERFCDRFNIGLRSAFNTKWAISDPAQVEALFSLLDKAYSAGLRRSARSMVETGRPIPAMVRRIYRNRKLRAKFVALATARERTLSQRNLSSVVQRVHDLVGILMQVNGGERSPLSFSSKFLHFQIGIVPIWDSIARQGLCRETNIKRFTTYDHYANVMLELLEQAYSKRAFTSDEIKRLDNYLLFRGHGR